MLTVCVSTYYGTFVLPLSHFLAHLPLITFDPNDPNAHFPIHSQPPNFQPAFTTPHRRARTDVGPRRRSHPSPRSSQERHTHLPLFLPLLHIHILIHLTPSNRLGRRRRFQPEDGDHGRGHARSRSEEAFGGCGRHVTPTRTRGGCATVFWSGGRGQGYNMYQDRTVTEADMEIIRMKRVLTILAAASAIRSGCGGTGGGKNQYLKRSVSLPMRLSTLCAILTVVAARDASWQVSFLQYSRDAGMGTGTGWTLCNAFWVRDTFFLWRGELGN